MFVIDIPYCDFDVMYQNGQTYDWIKVNKGKYIIIDKDKSILVYQRKNKKYFYCSEEDFYNKWFRYFDVSFDYLDAVSKAIIFSKNKMFLLPQVIKENRRVRILRQDPFKTMVYYLLDKGDTTIDKDRYIDERKAKMDSISELLGEEKKATFDGIKVKYNVFPNWFDISNINIIKRSKVTSDEFKRIEYLFNNLKSKDVNLDVLKCLNYNDAYGHLMKLYDDPNWIKSVMLYAFEFKEAFPIERKKTFNILQLSPKDFLEYDDIKGLIYEYIKTNERRIKVSGYYR